LKMLMKKITKQPKNVELCYENVHLKAQLSRLDDRMLRLDGEIFGEIELICDISGEAYIKSLKQPLVLYISDGFWDAQSQSKKLQSFDVIEFFDGFIDLDYISQSEIEIIRSDYHIKDSKE